mgnify:CR=1 FL=1
MSDKESYSFSDYPMSDEYSDYPTRKQILEYFNVYSKDNDILEHIEFNSTISDDELIIGGSLARIPF